MAELGLQANLQQSLQLLLAPRLLQMLKVLNLPYLELVEQISKEAEENVLLEVERRDEYVEFLRYLSSDRNIKKEADFSELPGLENFGRTEKTLLDHLLDQLAMADLEEDDREIAKKIIAGIDEQGYLRNYPEIRQQIMTEHNVSRPTVDKLLEFVQTFEPEGVGARNLKECLLIQAEAYNFEDEALQEVITRAIREQLDNLAAGELAKAAAALGIPEEGAAGIADFIKKNLTPYPGSAFGGTARQVIPSYAIEEKKNGGYEVISLENRYGPLIKLSPQYLKMLEDPKTDAATKEFLQAQLKRARELMEDISKRGETLDKIVRRIAREQEAFLKEGPLWLRPLTQQSLAKEFGLHPSTISRAIAGKYVQTPQGLYPLKLLCPRGTRGLTTTRLKTLLLEIIKNDPEGARANDFRLAELMAARGVQLSRRTVAFYRSQLGIPPGAERK